MQSAACRVLSCLLAACSLTATAGHDDSEGADALVDLGIENLLNLEVYTASRFPQARAEAPSALTVITAEQIRLYGYRSLDEILRSVPGVHISSDRVYQYIGVRGLRRPQDFNSPVLLLVDGQRINDGIYDSASIGTDFPVDVELIERVEFVRGPGSSVYGSNALLGVINVITRIPARLTAGRLTAEGGDAAARRALAQTDVAVGDGMASLLLSASYASRDGNDLYIPAFDDPASNNGVARNVDGDKYKRFMATLRAGTWRLQLVHSDRRKQVPLPIYGADFNDPRNLFRDTQGFVNLSYETEAGNDYSLQARLFNSYYRYGGDLAYDGILNLDRASARRWGMEARSLFSGWPHHRLIAGIELIDDYQLNQSNYDESPSAIYFDDRRSARQRGVFLQDEWALRESLKLTSGLRYDRKNGNGVSSPRIALIFQPAAGHSLKLLYGRAFRAPSTYERFYAASGYSPNPALTPERTTNWDLLWESHPAPSLRLQLGLQHFRIDHFIVEGTDSGGNIQYINSARVKSSGVDLDIEKHWAAGLQSRISLSLQRTHDGLNGGELIDSPDLIYKLYSSTPLPRTTARLALEIQGLNERRSRLGNANGYALTNLTLSGLRLSPALSISASLYNIFDHGYGDPLSNDLANQGIDQAPNKGREFRLGLDWAF